MNRDFLKIIPVLFPDKMVAMAKKAAGVSPVRKQYLDIKGQHPDAILFFRLGDFYETFDEDAQTIARELDIVLTSRNVSKGTRVPMAGIPHHAAENYLVPPYRDGLPCCYLRAGRD